MNQLNPESLFAKPALYYGAAVVFFVAGLINRVWFSEVPGDLSAYLSAADLFASGLDPYSSARFDTPRYDGFPYNYFPGTLPLIVWLAYVPTWLVVALDWCARAAVLVFSLRWLNTKINGGRNFHFVVGLALVFEPLVVDWVVGNMVTYLFGAFVLTARLSHEPRTAGRLFLQAAAGLLLAFKPFWFLPVGWVILTRRRWDLMAAVVCGGLAMVVLTATQLQFSDSFLAHTKQMRGFYYSVDLLNLWPDVLAPAVVVVVLAGLVLWQKRESEDLWILACLCLPVFPRLATYSYVLALPFVMLLFRELRPSRAFLASCVVIGPLPWILRDSSWMSGERLENWALFVWSILAMIGFYFYLWRADVSRPRTS